MPICNCHTHKCRNRELTQKVHKEHRELDQLNWRRKAYEAFQQAIDSNDEALSAEVAALTLSGVATGCKVSSPGATVPGTVLRALSDPHQPSPRGRTPVNDAFVVLNQLCDDLNALERDFQHRLVDHGRPQFHEDQFPLKEVLARARTLDSRLCRATTPSSTLFSQKTEYSKRIQALIRSLSDSGALWRARADKLRPPDDTTVYDTSAYFEPILNGVDPIIQVTLFTMVALQIILHLPRRGCRFLLSMIRYIVQLAFFQDRAAISLKKTEFIENFPIDPDTASQKFPLISKETIYAVCPNTKCHKTYAPTFRSKSAIPYYPKFCTHKKFPSGPQCGTALTRKRMYHETEFQIPVKSFVYFSFKDFLANLLSRLGFEDMMDNPLKSQFEDELKDVHDGQYLRIFTDANGEPFESSFDVGRYSFSLCMDFFNPFTNKQAGKKCSIGIISLVCLNLPPSHRYKAENMFLAGVIPGPKEPPLTATNHYLTPIIDDFLEFWQPGVRFSKTNKYPDGRLVLCALVLVICDLLAARKTGGFAGIGHEHFCSICHCTRSRQGYNNTDYHSWKRRTNNDCRAAAEQYRDAESSEERVDAVNATGVRWSELLRLPYFDISRCVIVDSMHNLFLGLLKEHFMGILGITMPSERKEPVIDLDFGTPPADFSENDLKGIKSLKNWLQAPVAATFPSRPEALKKLTRVNLNALKFVSAEVECPPLEPPLKSTKLNVATNLLDWRLVQTENQPVGAESSTRQGHVLGLAEMEAIWNDIREILTPSWATSVPSNLGSSSHGKLKADQWRALGTTHLPLTLIRVWGNLNSSDARSIRCRRILDVTMSLVSAVLIATSHTTSKQHAEAYLEHMQAYLNGIKELFPEYKLRPNHHMALHLHEFFLLFGPVHSWWTFPFERMIGVLQRMPTNFKIGELEATISRSYTRSANLRAVLLRHGCPEAIHKSEAMFQKLVDPQLRNSLQVSIGSGFLPSAIGEDVDSDEPDHVEFITSRVPRPFPGELKQLLNDAGIPAPSSGHLLADTHVDGLVYSTHSKHKGNSCVMLSDSTPAQIQQIVQLPTHHTLFAVRRHQPDSHHHNPYQRYPVLRAQLWSKTLADVELVKAKDILCHYACVPYDCRAIVVLPVSRDILL